MRSEGFDPGFRLRKPNLYPLSYERVKGWGRMVFVPKASHLVIRHFARSTNRKLPQTGNSGFEPETSPLPEERSSTELITQREWVHAGLQNPPPQHARGLHAPKRG